MKYFFIFLVTCIISCNQQNKGSQQKTAAMKEKLKGFFNEKQNRWVCEDTQYSTESFGDDGLSEYASVMKMDVNGNSLGMGLINRKGEIMVPIIYDGLSIGFTDSLCKVIKNDKLGLVNFEGKEIVSPVYQYIAEEAEDGLLRVGRNDLYGMINLQGKIVIPVVYQDLTIANEGMIAFMAEPQRWGFLNHKNEIVVKPEFTYVDKFKDGKVILQKADAEEYIVYRNGKVEKK